MCDTARLRGGIIARVGSSDHRGDHPQGTVHRFADNKCDAPMRDKVLATIDQVASQRNKDS